MLFGNNGFKTFLSLAMSVSALLSFGCARGADTQVLYSQVEASAVSSGTEVAENEYVIKRRGLGYVDSDSTFESKYGISIIKKIPSIMLDIVKVTDEESFNKLKESQIVEYIEPNYIREMKIQQSTDNMSVNTASVQQTGIAKANTIFRGKSYVSVAVISTGVDLKHPDLKNKLVTGYSAFSDSDSAQDINGVGTHQAGVIVASNPNTGVYGVAPDCRVMPVKAFNEDGKSKDGDLINGIVWAIDHGAGVVTFTAEGNKPSKALDEVVKYAFTKKVPLIVGSGDGSVNTATYPAATKGVIAVSAYGNNNSIASFSNSGQWISVSAPGEKIMSTSSTSGKLTPNYAVLSGSLVSAAYAAGEMALIKSKYPTLDMVALRNHLELTSDDLGSKGPDDQFGFGRIDVVKALMTQPPKK